MPRSSLLDSGVIQWAGKLQMPRANLVFRTPSPFGNYSLELISNNASALGSELKRSKEKKKAHMQVKVLKIPYVTPYVPELRSFSAWGGGVSRA